jgi:AcrR family transcriptional regulator
MAARVAGYFSRNRILGGASRVFAEKGTRLATVEDILQAAGVSRRTFYLCFKNKDEVLAALYEVASGLVLEALRSAARSTPEPMKKLERCVDAYLAFNQSDGELMRVLEAEALRPDSLLEPMRARLLEQLTELVSDILPRRRPDPLVVRGVLVALEAISHRVHAEGEVDGARLQRARRAMLRILLATLAGEGDEVPPLPFQPK